MIGGDHDVVVGAMAMAISVALAVAVVWPADDNRGHDPLRWDDVLPGARHRDGGPSPPPRSAPPGAEIERLAAR